MTIFKCSSCDVFIAPNTEYDVISYNNMKNRENGDDADHDNYLNG
jgi:hypothetical protein